MNRPIIHGCDFETDWNSDGSSTFVVQWCDYTANNVTYGTDIKEFYKILDAALIDGNIHYFYFHNLKFDISFMLDYLYDLQNKGMNVVLKTKAQNPIFCQIFNGKIGEIGIRDSSKKFPGDLASLGKSIGINKLESPRKWISGWSKTMNMKDPDSWIYIKRDCEIVYKAMQHVHDSGYEGPTVSSDAWRTAKEMAFDSSIPYWKKKIYWSNRYPILSQQLDTFLRESYYGGMNLTNNVGYNEGIINHLDVTSMYPTVLKYDHLPYGMPKKETLSSARNLSKLFIVKGNFKFTLKKNVIGIFKFKNTLDRLTEELSDTEYVTDMKEYHELTFTNIDLDTFSDFYDIDIEDENKVECYSFKGYTGFHGGYVDKFFEIKNNSTGIVREQAKLMLNGLYGKFGSNPEVSQTSIVPEGNYYKTKEIPFYSTDIENYVPMASFVTSYARRRLLDGVKKVGTSNLLHADTDSIIFLGNIPNTIDMGNNLGQWKNEASKRPIVAMYEGGVKRYVQLFDKEPKKPEDIKITCAGVPHKFDAKTGVPIGMGIELYDNPELITKTGYEFGHEHYKIESDWLRKLYKDNGLNPDDVNTMKKVLVLVDGGRVLKDTTFKMESSYNYGRSGY